VNEQPHLLIVEDDPDLAEMLSAFFHVQGYDVSSAAWGEDAVRLAQDRPPDLAILDIRLPDIDGYEICRRLRAQRRTQDVPVIFLTEKRDRVDKLTGLQLGVVDYYQAVRYTGAAAARPQHAAPRHASLAG
jgi:DNA-binding response OmpR family regulator